jgi:hypothetical protein
MFTDTINKYVYNFLYEVGHRLRELTDQSRLYMVYLFVGRLLLDYVAIVLFP